MENNELDLKRKESFEDTPFSEINALMSIQQPTRREWIKDRKVGNQIFSYVSGDLVIRLLNKAFRNRWSFEIKDTRVVESTDKWDKYKKENVSQSPVVQVLGSLTVPGWGTREQWGAQPIVGGQETQEHAFKAAGTDAMKKCASMFGITLDLYGQSGIEELMITPEDYLRDDTETFAKIKENILNRDKNIGQAEPDLEAEENQVEEIKEDVNANTEFDNALDIPQQNNQDNLVQTNEEIPAVNEKEINVSVVEEEVAPPAPTSSPSTQTKAAGIGKWRHEDIMEMKEIKNILGLEDNSELDKYVKEFMNNDQVTMKGHITHSNIRDFITFIQHNYLNAPK